MDENKVGISLDDIMNAADLDGQSPSPVQNAGKKVKIGGGSAPASNAADTSKSTAQSSAQSATQSAQAGTQTSTQKSKMTIGGLSSNSGISLDAIKSAAGFGSGSAKVDTDTDTGAKTEPAVKELQCHCPKCNNNFVHKYTGVKPTSVFCQNCGWDVMKPIIRTTHEVEHTENLRCPHCNNSFTFKYKGAKPAKIFCNSCGKDINQPVIKKADSDAPTEHTELMHCPKCGNDFEFSYKGKKPKEIFCNQCGENVLNADAKPVSKARSLKNFYLFDLFARMVEAKNWGLLAWIIINFVIIEAVFTVILSLWGLFLVGPLAYFISLAIALSPIGEELLRISNGCRKIKNKDIKAKIEPVFNEVYSRAKEKDPSISPKIELYICDDESENAFATGRRTVCITKGLAKMDSGHIAGVLAHEFGHLSHKDTDSLLIVVVGNLFMTVISTILGFISTLTGSILDGILDEHGIGCFSLLSKGITFLLTTAFMFVWTKLGALFCLKGGRKQEFAADHFAAELGYAQNLIDAFVEMEAAPAPKGLWATLLSTHPDTADRVMELQEYIEENQSALV